MLAVLESQCRFPKATDDTFLSVLKEALQGNSHFEVCVCVWGGGGGRAERCWATHT